MALQTWVAKFVVDHGRVTEEGGRLRTFERRRIDEPDADLYLLSQPAGEKIRAHHGQNTDEGRRNADRSCGMAELMYRKSL